MPYWGEMRKNPADDWRPIDDWIAIDPRYEIRITHRAVRIVPPEPWWERLWLDLKWRIGAWSRK